jgi:pimeloyl-ACP methyl ester carboxylesterase
VDAARIYLMGSGEGTLLAADAATRAQDDVHGLILYSVLPTSMQDALRYRASQAKPVDQGLLEAIDSGKFVTIDRWLTATDAATTPAHWLQDHYAYPAMESFLSQLDIPVGVFQGEADTMFPASGVKALESRLKQLDKTNFEFHYFEGLDQDLGLSHYFGGGPLPVAHREIFEFIKQLDTKKD